MYKLFFIVLQTVEIFPVPQKALLVSAWGDWSESECSVSCLGGTLDATRQCLDGEDGVTPVDDEDCPGIAEETRVCNTFECSGKMGHF